MKPKIAETDLAAVVVRHFQDLGADVYQEVAPWGGLGARADIVAVLGHVTHVIECKASFSLAVIEQAHYWKHRANLVSVAVPRSRKGIGVTVCQALAIGVYEVRLASETWETASVSELVPPALSRRVPNDDLIRCLSEKQKTYAEAGNATGKFWSPFKSTCEALRDVVKASPGLTLREAINQTKHHYGSDSNAMSSLRKWIAEGKVEGVAMVGERPTLLYPVGHEAIGSPAAQGMLLEVAS